MAKTKPKTATKTKTKRKGTSAKTASPSPALALLSVRAAAAALSVHEDTIHRLLERGELRAVRIGRAVRIEQDELVRYIHRQRGEPVPPPRNPMSPPQRACLHARADEVDRRRTAPRGTSKREALAAAAAEFGREFDSSSQLTIDEASWVIDWLTDKLVQLDEEAER